MRVGDLGSHYSRVEVSSWFPSVTGEKYLVVMDDRVGRANFYKGNFYRGRSLPRPRVL